MSRISNGWKISRRSLNLVANKQVSNSSWRSGSCHSHTLVMWQVVHEECNHDTTDKKNMTNYVTLLTAVWNIMKMRWGPLNIKMPSYGIAIPIIKIRQSDDSLTFITEIQIPLKPVFVLRRGLNHPVFDTDNIYKLSSVLSNSWHTMPTLILFWW